MKTPHLISHLLQTGCFLINQKKRMPTPFTTVQHCTGGLNQRNRSIQINKGCSNWKGRHKTLFADDMIMGLENPFERWCWRGLLRVPWTARRSNQSILMEISPGISLERMMLKLKLQYFGHLMRRVDSLEKTLMLGGIGGRRRRG